MGGVAFLLCTHVTVAPEATREGGVGEVAFLLCTHVTVAPEATRDGEGKGREGWVGVASCYACMSLNHHKKCKSYWHVRGD